MHDPTLWQWIGYAAAFTGVAVGVTASAVVGVTWFLEWLYPDKPTAQELADERAQHHAHGDCFPAPATFSDVTITKFAPVHGRAFGTGRAAE